MFELISAVVRYFAGGIKERRRNRLSISSFASSGCDIDLIV